MSATAQEASQAIRRVLEAGSTGPQGKLPEGADEVIRRSITRHYGLDDAEIVRRADKGLARRDQRFTPG